MTKPQVDALIFDMDGVLLDSEPFHLLAWQTVLGERFSVEYTARQHRQFLGRKDLFMAGELAHAFQLDVEPPVLTKLKQDCYLQLIVANAMPRRGVEELLQFCQSAGVPCALASSATRPTVECTVTALNFSSYFQCVVSGDEVEHGKPAPDIFLLAAELLGKLPERCIVIEDTYNGIKAAVAAGMRCIAVPCQSTSHEDHSMATEQLTCISQLHPTKLSELGLEQGRCHLV